MARRKISQDLKERAIVLVATGWDPREAARVLGVSERSVGRWITQMSHHGCLQEQRGLQGRTRVLHGEPLKYVRDLLVAHPSIYLDEITTLLAARFHMSLSVSALHKTLTFLGYTRKKLRQTPIQRDEVFRTQWKADITSRFSAHQLVFADESSKDDRTHLRRYGFAMAGQRACEVLSLKKGVRYSILPALSVNGILTVRVIPGSVTAEEFYDWVIYQLLPKMNAYPGPNSVLVIDNCRTHKSVAVRRAIEAAGCLLIFLPPYSPDLNPIEEAFSCLKYYLRRYGCSSGEYAEMELMEACIAAVTPEKARMWYAHSGYRFP